MDHEELKKAQKEDLKQHWKDYIPASAVLLAATGLVLKADKIHVNREEAAASAIEFYKSMQEKSNNVMRKSSAQEVDENSNVRRVPGYPVAKKRMAEEESSMPSDIRNRKIHIWEPYTRQWFDATQQEILWAELTANKMLQQHGSVTLNDVLKLYSDPNLKMTSKGKRLGWSYEDPMFQEGAGYYYAGAWIDMCPQFEMIDGSWHFTMDYGINPNDISNL